MQIIDAGIKVNIKRLFRRLFSRLTGKYRKSRVYQSALRKILLDQCKRRDVMAVNVENFRLAPVTAGLARDFAQASSTKGSGVAVLNHKSGPHLRTIG